MTDLVSIYYEPSKSLLAGWRYVPLKDICTRAQSYDPRKHPSEEFIYVDISSIDNTSKRIVEPKRLLGADAPSRARQLIRTGDVLVSTTRPNLNAVALITPEFDNQICSTGFCALRPGSLLDSQYLFAFVQTRNFVESLSDLVKGALYPAVTDGQVMNQIIPLPSLSEQKRIAVLVVEQLAAVERARAATQAQLDAASTLPAAYLYEIFNSIEAQDWPSYTLGTLCLGAGQYGTSEKASTEKIGTPVLRMSNLRDGRIVSDDLKYIELSESELNKYRLKDGDLLFNRTNSAELVGKTAIFDGSYEAVFASYLIRFRLNPKVALPSFVSSYINSAIGRQFIESHMTRAIGQVNISASTMHEMPIPLPAVATQYEVMTRLNACSGMQLDLQVSLQQQLSIVTQLPGALLHRAFSGELLARPTTSPIPTILIAPRVDASERERAAILAYIVKYDSGKSGLFRTILAKDLYLAETYAGVFLNGQYVRQAAGPLATDYYRLETLAVKQQWIKRQEHKRNRKRSAWTFQPGSRIAEAMEIAQTTIGENLSVLNNMLDMLVSEDTDNTEMVATIFAVWNDYILDQQEPTEEQIINTFREDWHPKKKRFSPQELRAKLYWMRENGLIPRGAGAHTTAL